MRDPYDPSLDDDEVDADQRTVVDNAFWSQPKVPQYPALARFGRFEILGRLARGGMAEVFLAREAEEDGSVRHVVLKRVLPEMADNPDFLAMFLDEGRTAVRLYHANVCHVYESGEIDGSAFMALEWVHGPSLLDVMQRATAKRVPIHWAIAVEIAVQAASALSYVHQAKGLSGRPLNIVHRDVSPHNIMLSWRGHVKLLDFGIAKTSGEERGGSTAGKYGYMSPEQAQSRPMDARSDIFALGIVLFELLTGHSLYDRPTLLDTLSAIVREPVPSLVALRPELPPALEHVVHRALAKDPAQRFQTAGELRAALKQVLRTAGQLVPETRISLALDALFDAPEKEALRPEQRKLTGSFEPLTQSDAAAVLEQVTYETFAHRSEPPPASPPKTAPKKKRKKGRGVLFWLAATVLLLVAAAVGAAAALYVLAPELLPRGADLADTVLGPEREN